jgi:hypothetical protein
LIDDQQWSQPCLLRLLISSGSPMGIRRLGGKAFVYGKNINKQISNIPNNFFAANLVGRVTGTVPSLLLRSWLVGGWLVGWLCTTGVIASDD